MSVVSEVHIQDGSVTTDEMVRISCKAEMDGSSDNVIVIVARFDNVVIPLENGPGNYFRRAIPAFKIGPYSGTPNVFAIFDVGEGGVVWPDCYYGTADKELTVTASDPIIPEEFMRSLYEGELDFQWKGQDPKVYVTYDERRINRANEFGVIIKPNKMTRENTTRMHTKNVKYPMTIYVIHPESYEECKKFFDHVLNTEEANINLTSSDIYDWLEPKDDGYRIPTRKVHKIVHDVVLHADVVETNIPDT